MYKDEFKFPDNFSIRLPEMNYLLHFENLAIEIFLDFVGV